MNMIYTIFLLVIYFKPKMQGAIDTFPKAPDYA